jgi:hypothetical protein
MTLNIELSDIFKDIVRNDWKRGPDAVIGQIEFEANQHLARDDEEEYEYVERRAVLKILIKQYWNEGPDVFFERFAYWLNRNSISSR